MPKARHQVFICHSSRDQALARDVVGLLEAHAARCWVSFRDIDPGENYQEAIVRAIRRAWIVVFLFSEDSNRSGEVKKELSLASSFGLLVLPLRLAAVRPNEALLYELATSQWVDGWPDMAVALDRLRRVIVETLREMANSADTVIAGKPVQHSAVAVAPPPEALTADSIRTLHALLTRHIGPIARVVLKRALQEAATPAGLCRSLAAHVPDANERATFLREALAGLKK